MSHVQSCITAISFPDSLEAAGRMHDSGEPGIYTDIDALLPETAPANVSWTAPRWIGRGDLLFFYHTKRGVENVRRLQRQILQGASVTGAVRAAIDRAAQQATAFGEAVFACALVGGRAVRESPSQVEAHFRSTIFAPLETVYVFEHPISRGVFSAVVTLSTGGTLTPLNGASFTGLKKLIARHNALPGFLADALPGTSGFRAVTHRNWRTISTVPSHVFLDESQLRAYLVDHLLREIKDPRTPVHEECDCYRGSRRMGIADYFVRVGGTWFPVETKLSLLTERDLANQVAKYMDAGSFCPRRGPHRGTMVEASRARVCLVADQEGLYVMREGSFVGGSAPGQRRFSREELAHASPAAIRDWLSYA